MFKDGCRCDRRDEACQDCVVAIIGPRSGEHHLEAEELRALSVLADAGLVPPLRRYAEPVRLPGPGVSRKPSVWAYPATKAS
jgi:hypothetical protein